MSERRLHELLRTSARRAPDAVAVLDGAGGSALSYRALD